jgi:hypothetical protein
MHCYEQRNQSQWQQVQPSYVRMGLVETSEKCRPKHDHVEQVNQTLDGVFSLRCILSRCAFPPHPPHEARVPGHVGFEDRGEAADRRHLSRRMVDWLNQVYRETRGGPIPIEGGDLPTPGRGTQSRVRMLAK